MRSKRPASDGLFLLSLLGLGLAILFLFAATLAGWSTIARAFGALGVYALPQLIAACRQRAPAIRAGLNLDFNHAARMKYMALVAAYLLIFGGISAAEAAGFTRFAPARPVLAAFLPCLLILALPYVCLVNRLDKDARDDYYEVGTLLLGRNPEPDWHAIREFLKGWLIKAFFFPLMFYELLTSLTYFEHALLAPLDTRWYQLGTTIFYFSNVCLASAGYLTTFRLFGWQIRSTNPYLGGWFFTLLCYYPFFGAVYRHLLDYKDGYIWSDWLAGAPVLFALWGAAILFFKLCWIWSVAPFGLRFSNLTNRGIMTDGAFRFTKHPSYVSKNIFWWLISVPFVSQVGGLEAVTHCVQLLTINIVYYLRAKYEEAHLAEEPKYRDYARWIDGHGLFSPLGRLFPFLRFHKPAPHHPAESPAAQA